MIESDAFLQQVRAAHAALGIASAYLQQCALPICPEPVHLVATEPDYFARPQQLTPPALAAWQAMKQSASGQGVTLFLISAFRSVRYQQDLIARKLEKGLALEQILQVNAAPGFSEHHTGRAIDIGTDAESILLEEFENTTAFQWLAEYAPGFGYHLSYPRHNPMGIAYEPWHWCFRESEPAPREA